MQYLKVESNIYSKRIDDKRAKNTTGPRGNKWLYPDLVGMEDISKEWKTEIKDFARAYFKQKTKLWSFEVKLEINRSNLRLAFFQAVSNSSWANFGYLVASEISGTNTLKECRMLSSLHGIGLILLNPDNPAESQIIIPAKEREEIDWDTANRLASENEDFKDYIASVSDFNERRITKHSWDSA